MGPDEDGFAGTGLYVCVHHFTSPTARLCITESAAAETEDAGYAIPCFDCQRTPAGSVDTLIELILTNSDWLYEPYSVSAANGLHKVFGDQSIPAAEMIEELTGAESGGSVCAAIADALLEDDWIETHWDNAGLSGHVTAGWEDFSYILKHCARFTVMDYLREHEPALHDVVAGTLQRLSAPSLRTVIPAGATLYRARMHARPAEGLDAVEQLLPPPIAVASAGRMNPSGIPLFYAAFDADTALDEVFTHSSAWRYAVCGEFVTDAEIQILDLTGAPYLVDLLSGDRRQITQAVFLNRFVESISRPLNPIDDPHSLDYLPTQYLVEAIERSPGVWSTTPPVDVAGIAYPSAIHSGGRNVVLFPGRVALPGRPADPLPGGSGAKAPQLTMTRATWREVTSTRVSWGPVHHRR